MNNRYDKWRKLKRKKFNEVISEAYKNYLNDIKEHPKRYSQFDRFYPDSTPNRNPEQVPNGTWRRLIFKYLNNHFDN